MKHQAYEYEMLNRLTKVKTHGTVEIFKEELKFWYDVQRVTVGVWRDIDDRWRSLEPKKTNKLLLAETASSWILIWGYGLGTTKDSWFKDVRNLAGRATPEGKDLGFEIHDIPGAGDNGK
ncbi:hypothetical protein ELH42_29855 (plasmid) [Rhizobium ruizarguesonis]|uniref:hypothetical protein n=1 Tax=Rhizobium ruizarguesonis TaxID=2081791 RepID=UPI001030DA10|nr:hypothetical protein [Rhizobium ruizarguesonis]TBB60044.1 hypothetical protein ELH42_29855 [Rhizobium ruizarguesonis]